MVDFLSSLLKKKEKEKHKKHASIITLICKVRPLSS